MADFNVKVASSGDSTGFIGASRGVAAPEAQKFATDNSKAMKTQGLANDVAMGASLFQTTVKFADDAIKQNIDNTAHDQMDQVYNEFGVGDVALQGNDVKNEPLPSEIQGAEKNLSRLAAARTRGTVNENSYWARVESISRQLRAKYPGHRDYIDQRISSIAGGDPANNIVRNLQEEAAKAAAKANSEENRKLSYVEDLSKKGVLLNGWEKMSFSELVNNHAPLLRDIAQTEQDAARINLAKSRNEATDILASRSVTGYVNRQLDMATSNLVNPNNESFSSMANLIEKGNKSGALSPDEMNMLRTQMSTYKLHVTEEVMSGLRQNFGDVVTPKMLQEAQAQINDHMAIYENALANKDYGLLSYTMHRLEDQKNNDQVSLSKSPVLRLNAALTSYLGPQSSELMMQWSSGLASARDKAAFAENLVPLIADKNNQASLYTTLNGMSGKVDDMGRMTEAMVNANVAVMNTPSAKPEAVAQVAKALYGVENAPFLGSIKGPANKEKVYNRLVNQTVFDRMKALRDSGDATSYNNYVGWSKNAFPVLFRGAADDLSRVTTESGGINVQFSPESNQFVVNSPDPNSPAISGKDRAGYGQTYDQVTKAVNRMNSAIRGILPIVKEEGTEPVAFLGTAFKNLGINGDGNVLGTMTNTFVKGAMKLGASSGLTPEDMAIVLPKGTELLQTDPTNGNKVSRFRPGDTFIGEGIGGKTYVGKQITPEEGDNIQLNELSGLADRKKQDLLMLQQMTKENPEDTGLRDQLKKVVNEYSDILNEIHTINNSWVEQFKTPTNRQ